MPDIDRVEGDDDLSPIDCSTGVQPDQSVPPGIADEITLIVADAAQCIPAPEKDGSRANAPHTIASVLLATEEFLGKGLVWKLPEEGSSFEQVLPQLRSQLEGLSDVLRSKAQKGGVDAVNKFLRDNGFYIELRDSGVQDDVYAASVLNIPVTCSKDLSATRTTASIYSRKADGSRDYRDSRSVGAVAMNNLKDIYEVRGHSYPIIKLGTNSGDNVYVTQFDGTPPSGMMGLYKMVSDWQRELGVDSKQSIGRSGKYTGNVVFPMVDFKRSGDINEILGATAMGSDGRPAIISQAKYEHVLKMNEKGAVAKAAAAIAVMRSLGGPKSIYIDGPFVVWFERDGVIPFSAYITEKDMNNPGNLV